MYEIFKDRYDLYASNLTSLNGKISDLKKRYQIFRKKCERNIFSSLFNRRRLKILSISLKDAYTLFDELNRRRTFIWGMVSKISWMDESYIDKTINHSIDDENYLEEKLKEIENLLLKCEK